MRLWTIQPEEVWRTLQVREVLYADEVFAYEDPPESYVWLVRQLRRRIGCYKAHFPWWFYCSKPDIRRQRHRFGAGQVWVRLECDVPSEEVVTMPCWAWNEVYCQQYLALGKREGDSWTSALRAAVPDEDAWPLPPRWQVRLKRSWERLFDPKLPGKAWRGADGIARMFVGREAVSEKLRLSSVRKVDAFRGTSRLLARLRGDGAIDIPPRCRASRR